MKNFDHATFIANLKAALRRFGENSNSLSQKIDVGQSSIHKILSGKTVPTAETLAKIIGYLGLDANWVLFNDGDMLKSSGSINTLDSEILDAAIPIAARILNKQGEDLDLEHNHTHRDALIKVYNSLHVQIHGFGRTTEEAAEATTRATTAA